jgi:predicted aspartyl protease
MIRQFLFTLFVAVLWPNLVLANTVNLESSADGQDKNTIDLDFTFYQGSERERAKFEIVNGFMVLKVFVNGEELYALLDNAAGNTVIDSEFAKSSGIYTDVILEPFNVDRDPIKRNQTEVAEIDIPGVLSVIAPWSSFELRDLSDVVGRKISVVLGGEFFKYTSVIISFADTTLDIGPSSGLKIPSESFVTMNLNAPDRFMTSAFVENNAVNLLVDMGFNEDVMLPPSIWDRIFSDEQESIESYTWTPGGSSVATKGMMGKSISIGGTSVENVRLYRGPSSQSGGGILGLGVLRRFRFVVFDVAKRKVYLRP